VGFDYSYLKKLTRVQASAAIDFSGFAVLESVELCALDVHLELLDFRSELIKW
jgi:hypothetical protein